MSDSTPPLPGGAPPGGVARREVIGGVLLGEVQHAADADLAPHRHAAASLSLVVRGGLTLLAARAGAGVAVLGAGSVTFDPEDHVHGGRRLNRAVRRT